MATVYIIDKETKTRTVFESGISESSALILCECWGWSYMDENGQTYWLEYEL